MKLLGITNCLVITNFTRPERNLYFDMFGSHYWNENENIVCWPVGKSFAPPSEVIANLEIFFRVDLSKVEFLILLIAPPPDIN